MDTTSQRIWQTTWPYNGPGCPLWGWEVRDHLVMNKPEVPNLVAREDGGTVEIRLELKALLENIQTLVSELDSASDYLNDECYDDVDNMLRDAMTTAGWISENHEALLRKFTT